MSEALVVSGTTTWRDYVASPDQGLVALRLNIGGTVSVDYVVTDHLGSTSIVTGATGTVTERDSYDSWGRRRNANGSDAASCTAITSVTTRGFTGQEHIDQACAINFNARVYDPTIAKFLSPDSMVPDAMNGQSYNRFAYVINNPLALIDPSGNQDIETVTVTAMRTSSANDGPGIGYDGGSGVGANSKAIPEIPVIDKIEEVIVIGQKIKVPSLAPPINQFVLPPLSMPPITFGSSSGADRQGGGDGTKGEKPKPCSTGKRIAKGVLGGQAALEGTAMVGMGFSMDVIGGGAIVVGCGQPGAPATCALSVFAGASIITASGGAYWGSYEAFSKEAIPDLEEFFGTCTVGSG